MDSVRGMRQLEIYGDVDGNAILYDRPKSSEVSIKKRYGNAELAEHTAFRTGKTKQYLQVFSK